jgi:hypothetical protein
MQLEEQFYELDRTKLKRWLPWLHLWRAFRLAIHPRSIVLGCLAILLLEAGFAAITRLPFVTDARILETLHRNGRVIEVPVESLTFSWENTVLAPLASVRDAFAQGVYILHPVMAHATSASALFRPGGGVTGAATAITGLLLCLLVWSLCGVGIARMAAVRFAVAQPVRLREAIAYAGRKLGSSTGSVIVPLLGVLSLWFAGLVLGLLGNIPGIGGAIVGIGWGLAMLAGLAMALILLGLAVGWPLMLASIAVEDADAFDAFGRTYNYVFARPWYLLFLVVLMLLYGSALLVFAATLLTATNTLAAWAVGSGLTGVISEFGGQAIATWQNIGRLILHGFVVSYFWSATTIIYVLLRKSEDATPLEAVTLPQMVPPGDGDLPLVGIPAAEKREGDATDSDGSTEQQE